MFLSELPGVMSLRTDEVITTPKYACEAPKGFPGLTLPSIVNPEELPLPS
jgi:hypothetical protein